MEVRARYTRTEVGIVPDDWKVLSLDSISNVSSGKRLPKGFYVVDYTTQHPYLRVKDMQPGNVSLKDIKYVPEEAFPFIKQYRIYKEDLFISVAGTLGIVGKIPIEIDGANLTENANRVTNITCDRDYLLYVMLSPIVQRVIESIYTIGAQPKLALTRIRNFKIPLPPTKKEQQAIATALTDVDSLIQGLDKLIAKKRDIKQATMQELLTGKTRLPGFDGEWEEKKLGEIADITMGQSPASTNYNDSGLGLPLIQGNADIQNRHTIRRIYTTQLTKLGRRGSIIMSVRAPVGEIAHTDFDICLGRGVCAIHYPNNYLYHLLIFIEPTWSRHSKGSTFDSVNSNDIYNVEVNIPANCDEQIAIATILSDMDKEIEALEKRREKTLLLKQGMMQELLTGKTRLVKPATKDTQQSQSNTANIHFQRSVLAAEIVSRLHEEPTFGHVKFEKMIFLVEHLCDIDTGSNYQRKAAGPYDNRALRSIDSQLKKQKWFEARRVHGRYKYVPLEKANEHSKYFTRYFSDKRDSFANIIDTFRTADTERCEIVATLYSAWNDLLQQQTEITDERIIHEVLNNWHESKKRIPEERWQKALEWMRDKGFVPTL